MIITFFVFRSFSEKKPKNITNTKNDSIVNDASLDTDNNNYKIVAFGDSLTAGYGVDLKDSYPSILEAKLREEKIVKNKNLNITVLNMGVSGETTTGGLERVDFIISQNPNLILLGLGANDMLRGLSPKATKGNLDSIMKRFTEKNIPIILLGMQSQISNGLGYKKEFDDIYPTLAKKYNSPLVPFFLKGVVLVPSLNISDGIHPNREGYEKIVQENIMPTLLNFLKQ